MPKVSVIIPVYNVEKYLRECLDSVINQTLKDIEIICVNDGSPDNSLLILQEYAKNDTRIKIIDLKKNVGIGKARNIAFKEVSAPYVMYLDSDDWYEPDACEKAYEQINKNGNDFVLYRAYSYSDKTGVKKFRNERYDDELIKFDNIPNIKFYDLAIPYLYSIAAWYKIYSVAYLKKHNISFKEGMYYEDQYFWYSLLLTNPDFSLVNRPLICNRNRIDSATKKPDLFVDLIHAETNAFELFKKHGNAVYLKYYIIDCLRIIPKYLKFSENSILFDIKNYNKFRNFIIMLNNEINITEIKDEIQYKEFKKILKQSLFQKLLLAVIKNIFSIKNKKNRKIITLFWIKIKIKRNKNQ